MTEKYINTIQNVDCLEFMRTLPDKCIDLVLTDPPYGFNRFETDHKNYLEETVKPAFIEIERILKDSAMAIVFTGTGDIKNVLNAINLDFQRIFFMYKPADMTFPFMKWLLKSEAILLFSKGKPKRKKKYIHYCHDVMQHTRVGLEGVEGHPTVKPLAVMEEFTELVNENDIIFDPFMGSGTTAIACLKTNRRFIGCEISSKYCDIAEKRIDDYKSQYKLELI